MNTHLYWKKGLFDSLFRIYKNGKLLGTLKNPPFKQTATGEFNNKAYIFKTMGLFKQQTIIIDAESNSEIGHINYHNWMTRATITLADKTIQWKYENVWNTKWQIFDGEKLQINYSGSSSKGQIHASEEDALPLLCGLFVTNHYWQMTIGIMVAVLVPIYATIFR